MKTQADRRRCDVEYEVGKMVYLKFRPYCQATVTKRPCEKLAPKYFGPYQIVKRISKVAYKLDLPDETSIHPMFHLSQLKQALNSQTPIEPHPPQLKNEFEWIAEPQDVYAYRFNDQTREWELLV